MRNRSSSRLATFKKSLSLIARQKISAALKGKKRGKYNKRIGVVLAAAGVGGAAIGMGLLLKKKVSKSSDATQAKYPGVEDPWDIDLKASRDIGRRAGANTAHLASGFTEGLTSTSGKIVKAYGEKGRTLVRQASRKGSAIAKVEAEKGWQRDKKAKMAVQKTVKAVSQSVKPQINAGWERDRKAKAWVVGQRKKYLGFSGTPRLITFAKAKRRSKPLTAQHKQKISAALKGRKRKPVDKAEQVRAGSLAFNRVAGGLSKGADAVSTLSGAYKTIQDSNTRKTLARSTAKMAGIDRALKAGGLLVGVGGLVNSRLGSRERFRLGNRQASISKGLGLKRLALEKLKMKQLNKLRNNLLNKNIANLMAGINIKP